MTREAANAVAVPWLYRRSKLTNCYLSVRCTLPSEEVKAAALKDPKSFPRSSIDSYFAVRPPLPSIILSCSLVAKMLLLLHSWTQSFTANKRVQNPLKEDAANDDDDTGVDDDETE
jgi:hypothetical protein